MRALRHAGTSLVIDLSHISHEEKLAYMQSVLPALATLRRHTGLPHRVIVDEAHYFLDDPHAPGLLDLEVSGYTLVTYRASKLRRNLLAASQAVIVTRESDPQEVRALRSLCESCEIPAEGEWARLFENLVLGEAVVLPITEEAEGEARRIRLTPRLTPHVRHLAKYLDLPVSEGSAFVFWRNGSPTGQRARTLRQFVEVVEQSSPTVFEGHLRRHDFSRWIGDVFGDYPMARTLRQLEDRYLADGMSATALSLVQAIRARYEFTDPIPGVDG